MKKTKLAVSTKRYLLQYDMAVAWVHFLEELRSTKGLVKPEQAGVRFLRFVKRFNKRVRIGLTKHFVVRFKHRLQSMSPKTQSALKREATNQ